MIFAPLATRKYGIQFKRVLPRDWWDAPDWVLHLKARWGCERAKRIDRLDRLGGGQQFHPLVYLSSEWCVNGDVGRDLGCWCGDLSGQYIEPRDRDKVWFGQTGEINSPPGAGRFLDDDSAARAARLEYEQAYASERQAAGVPGQWIGPDESGGRRYVASWKRRARFMSEGESDRRLVRPIDWNVADRVRCFCGHDFASHVQEIVRSKAVVGACTWRESVFADIARDDPSGAKCMCQEYSPATVTAPQTGNTPIALGTGSGLFNDTMEEVALFNYTMEEVATRRVGGVYSFEGFDVTEAEAQDLLKNMVPGSTINDAMQRIARSKRIEWNRNNPGAQIGYVADQRAAVKPVEIGATGRAMRAWDDEV